MFYHDFDLCIDERHGDYYPLKAESRTRGETRASARGKLFLKDCLPELDDYLAKLEAGDANREFAKTFGRGLYRCLFRDDIGNLYQQSLGRVSDDKELGLRIKLEIAAPELSAVPWELLHDGERFLSTSTKTPLTRFIGQGKFIEGLKTTLPIRVLLVIPEGAGLDAEGEVRGVVEALEEMGEAVEYRVLDRQVTSRACRDALQAEPPYNIFHFIGHGSYGEDDQGCLDLNGDMERVRPLRAESFALFFQDYPSAKLVILNSCEGARVSATRPLAGVVPQLVSAGIPAVIAMQYPIRDAVAKMFAREFYKSLCGNESAGQGRVDSAIAYARRSVCQEFDETNEFAIPVLFMRSPNGVIFDLQTHKSVTSLEEAHTFEEVAIAYEHNEEAAPLERQREEAARAAQQLRVKIREWRRRVVVTSLLTALAVAAALWVSLFGLIDLDDYLERRFVTWLMDPIMSKPFAAEDVRLVMIQEGENGVFGKFDPKDRVNNVPRWRTHYAKLIDDLSGAGAKVVALDFYFIPSQNPTKAEVEANGKLAKAIRDAEGRGAGTKVIFGVRTGAGGAQAEGMPEEIKNALNGSWGDVDNLWTRWRSGLTREALLGRKLADGPAAGCAGAEASVLPSFPLLAVMHAGGPAQPAAVSCPVEEQGRVGNWKQPVRACLDEDKEQLNLRDADGQLVKQIPFQYDYWSEWRKPEPVPMLIKLDLARVPQLQSVTETLEAIYNPTGDGDPKAPDNWRLKNPGEYGGKIVMIGVQRVGECGGNAEDIKCVSDSEGGERKGKRYGVEIQANILSNLLTCVYVRPVTVGWSLLITLLMVALGALLQTVLIKWRGVPLPFRLPLLDKPLEIPILLPAIFVVYFLVAVVAYKQGRVLFGEFHYHLLALFVAYWLVGLTRRRLGAA